jgi:hypothetical protein
LYITENEIKQSYKEFDIFNVIEMKYKNPATIMAINAIEKLCKIKRFEYDKIKHESYDIIKKYITKNKIIIGDAMYGFYEQSKTTKEKLINAKIEDIKDISDVRNLLVQLYNKYAPFYKKELKKRIVSEGNKRERIYQIIKCNDTFEHINVFRKIIKERKSKEEPINFIVNENGEELI